MKKDLNNIAIKCLSPEHGKVIIEYLSQYYPNTRDLKGNNTGCYYIIHPTRKYIFPTAIIVSRHTLVNLPKRYKCLKSIRYYEEGAIYFENDEINTSGISVGELSKSKNTSKNWELIVDPWQLVTEDELRQSISSKSKAKEVESTNESPKDKSSIQTTSIGFNSNVVDGDMPARSKILLKIEKGDIDISNQMVGNKTFKIKSIKAFKLNLVSMLKAVHHAELELEKHSKE